MIYAFDDFELDAARLELRRRSAVVKVDRIVLRVLAVLLRSAGRLVTKDELVEEVWDGRAVADNVLTVSIARLRRALQDRRGAREFVVTVYGLGYRFVRPVVTRNAVAPLERATTVVADASPPLVGRGGLLEDLRRALAEASVGRGRVCVLMGEAGIGKTRVVGALADELAGASVQVAWGYCRESGSTPPLYPWLQLLRKLFETEPDAHWDALLGPVAAELRGLLRESDVATHPPATGDVQAPPRAPLRNIAALLRAFVGAATVTPWLLVLEDLHRADAASLEVMSLLVDEIGRSRLLVVATVRDKGAGRTLRLGTPLPYVLGHSNTERMLLKRLSEEDVIGYVASSLEDPEGRIGRAVYAKSEGNAFFMTELVRQLRRTESRDPDDLPLPEAALDVVRQRVVQLEPDTRSLLTAAAVLGARFELALLQQVTGLEAGAIARSLDDAIAADLLIASPDSPTAFSFGHDLLRAVLYDEITPTERRRRHLETAIAIERHAEATHVPAPVGELADHFYAALPESDLPKTVRYCDEAARRAGASFANTDVARHLQHALAALALMPAPPLALRKDLLLRLAIYTRGSAPEVFTASIHEVARLARESGDARTLLRSAMMFHVHPEFSSLPGATEALEHTLSLTPPDALGQRAAALASLATAAPRAYSAAQSRACLEEAETLARAAPHDEGLQVVLTCKLFTYGCADEATNAEVVAELDRLGKKRPDRAPIVPLFITIQRAVRLLQRGDQEGAQGTIEHGKARARLVRHPELLWYLERFDALACFNRGASAEGKQRLQALHRQAERRPILGSAAFCAFDRVLLLSEVGAPAHVDDELRCALAFQAWDAPGIWALKVRALAASGLLDEARSSLAAVPAAKLGELPRDSQYLGTLGHLARAALVLGARDYIEALDRLLAPFDTAFAGHAAYLCEGAVPQLRGMLARARGQVDQARPMLERGLRMNEQAGFVSCAVETRLELGKCLVATGQLGAFDAARQLASRAHALSEQHGLVGKAQSAASLLSDIVTARAAFGG